MNKMKFIKTIAWVFIFVFALNSCKDQMEEHYAAPDWLKGNAWEALEERGNYSIFLKGAELAGFEPIMKGKSLVTVMAPDDEVFSGYLSENGKSSIEDYSAEELQKLIGFHIMYYSYDKNKLVNFRPEQGDGATEDEKEFAAGLYYKHRTRSLEAPTAGKDTSGNDILIYHNEALLPVFSHRMFSTKNIDAKYNYEYFYSGSNWTGDNGFNVSNASVDEYEIIANNGYLYLVDQVVNPLNTIHAELESRPDYSTYLDLYDFYSYYELDEELTVNFGNGSDLYRHRHEAPLADIALEWPSSNYRAIGTNSSLAYSTFAPSNSAFQNFMEEYWTPGGYSDLSEVNNVAIRYLIRNSYYSDAIVFPEEISSGRVVNDFDAVINFDVDAVPAENRVVCQNGVFYGLEDLTPPGMFYSVTGPAFKQKDLSWYLYMLDPTDLLVSLSSAESNFTLLIPSNTQMEEGGIGLEGDELWSSDGGDYGPMNSSTMIQTVNLHTVTGGIGISSSGIQVLRTNIPYTYWFVKDGQITTSVLFNNYFELPTSTVNFYDITETTNSGADWSNGKAYTYDSPEIFRPIISTQSMQYRLAITQDATYPYYKFSQLLRDAGVVDAARGSITFLNGVRCVAFVPTNDAIDAAVAAGEIPGVATDGTITDQGLLANYLRCYFVPTEDNGMSTYPYIGSGVNGDYETRRAFFDGTGTAYTQLSIFDDGQKLSVQLKEAGFGTGAKVDVVPDFYYFPFSYNDGGAHYIDGVL